MTNHKFTNLGGLNLYQNPLSTDMGHLIHAVNVVSEPYGAKSKRPGVTTYGGTATGNVTKIFSWYFDGEYLSNLYKMAGSVLYYDFLAGGTWTPAGNGTFSSSGTLNYAVQGSALIVGDGVGSTRHTDNFGTAFTNTSLAPIASDLVQFDNRIYAAGTTDTLFASSANDGTNWNTSGTSDSFSITIPGDRKLSKLVNNNNRLIATKMSGVMHSWDGDTRRDLSTRLGPSSPQSVAQVENTHFWVNPTGIFMYNGGQPQLISNAIQQQLYNNSGSGMQANYFNVARGGAFRNDYLLEIGTSVTDTISSRTILNPVVKYNFQHNEFLNWSYPFYITSFGTYQEVSGTPGLYIGGANGQVYRSVGTELTDAGTAIPVIMEYVVHWNTLKDKTWREITLQFNPGCQAQIAISAADSFQDREKRYVPLGDVSTGKIEYRFPQGSESTYLFIKVTESSKTARFTWYGFELDAEVVTRR